MNIFNLLAKISLLYPVKLQNKLSKQLDKIYTYRMLSCIGSNGGGKLLINRYIRLWHGENIYIGRDVHINSNCVLATHPGRYSEHPKLTIGNGSVIGEHNHITCANSITIGENLLTGRRVTITDNSHGDFVKEQLDQAPWQRPLTSKGPVKIGKNVWLGENVIVLPGVTIGDNVTVGANSVVSKDIPSNSLAVGTPAKVIKTIK